MDGQDVIGHLMGVEREAASLLADAKSEADRRKHAASDESSRLYKEAYEAFMSGLESELEQGRHEIDLSREAELDAYQARVEALPTDPAAFARYLDSLFVSR